VRVGAFTWLDQGAVDHLMPGLGPPGPPPGLLDALLPLQGDRGALDVAVDLWLYAASAGVSALAIGAICLVLRRRGRRRAALLWAAALLVGTVVELAVKHGLERPALYVSVAGQRLHIVSFDHSLPSGHTLRSTLIAALIATAWPRLGRWALAWAASIWVVLLLAAAHTPTDIVAGALLGAALVLLVRRSAHDA
jgi:membrane-associated phospholipid phosphatase